MTLVLSLNSYQLIVPGRTPNVHLIPSSNANDQNKSICDLPFSTTQSHENLVTSFVQSLTFQVPLAPPSWVVHPLARLPHIRRFKYQGIYLPKNYHTSHSMLMEINGHYWVPMPHNGHAPEVLY